MGASESTRDEFFVRKSDLIEVVHHVWIEAGLAVRQVLARSLVREAVRCVEQPFATPPGIEVLLGDFPDFVLQHGKSIFGEINEFAMECFGPSRTKPTVDLGTLRRSQAV